ncbi:formate dehydrogenase accessory protein FdhE [Bacillus sp. Bva_UNVM-123]|uniref:formate dehydrogenase accessory protein FdhE n=1 Tax=Bacillus sp. Bva_UNVM-123 TaxID=2829798 RepID=UPI00391FACF9
MAKNSVLDNNYEKLQTAIQALHDTWIEQINDMTISNLEKINKGKFPLIPQVEIKIDLQQYRTFIVELLQLIGENKSELQDEGKKITVLLTTELLEKWFKETIAVNQFYFHKFAEENGIPEWLPVFVAEHAARPYIQKATEQLAEPLKGGKDSHACPSCGEPARFALVGKNGGKEMTCPRCLHQWDVKKISCAHCGTEGNLVVLKIEGEETAEIHACNKCKGYTKVIDIRKLFKKESPTLLDVKNIHLDFIAQEKGFGIQEESNSH